MPHRIRTQICLPPDPGCGWSWFFFCDSNYYQEHQRGQLCLNSDDALIASWKWLRKSTLGDSVLCSQENTFIHALLFALLLCCGRKACRPFFLLEPCTRDEQNFSAVWWNYVHTLSSDFTYLPLSSTFAIARTLHWPQGSHSICL